MFYYLFSSNLHNFTLKNITKTCYLDKIVANCTKPGARLSADVNILDGSFLDTKVQLIVGLRLLASVSALPIPTLTMLTSKYLLK